MNTAVQDLAAEALFASDLQPSECASEQAIGALVENVAALAATIVAVARRLAVPDLTTTVLTLTVTGLVADDTSWSVRLRRLVPVLAMLGGALAGGALLRWVDTAAPLWAAGALLVGVAVAAHVATKRPHSDAWQ